MRSIARRTAVGGCTIACHASSRMAFWLALATWRTKLVTKSGFLGY